MKSLLNTGIKTAFSNRKSGPDEYEIIYGSLYYFPVVSEYGWYVPSRDELSTIITELVNNGIGYYSYESWEHWSTSTEDSVDGTRHIMIKVSTEEIFAYSKELEYGSTVPVKAFTLIEEFPSYEIRKNGRNNGYIFHIDSSVPGQYTYYEAYHKNTPGYTYSNIYTEVGPAAQGTAIGAGATNCQAIIAQPGHTYSYALHITTRFTTSNVNLPSDNKWRIPSDTDLSNLAEYFGDLYEAAPYFKSTRTDPDPHPRWPSPNNGTDIVNFKLVPAGYVYGNSPVYFGLRTKILTCIENEEPDTFRARQAEYNNDGFESRLGQISDGGASVRLIRNATESELLLDDGTYVADYVGNDGKSYKAVKIDDLVWTAENLAETKWQNGDDIPSEYIKYPNNDVNMSHVLK